MIAMVPAALQMFCTGGIPYLASGVPRILLGVLSTTAATSCKLNCHSFVFVCKLLHGRHPLCRVQLAAALSYQQLLSFLACVQMYCTGGIRCDVYSSLTLHHCSGCCASADVLHGRHPL
jgi:hypothetical protein